MELTYTQKDIFTLIERDLAARGLSAKDTYYRVSTTRMGYPDETTNAFTHVVTPIDEAIQIELTAELEPVKSSNSFFGGSSGLSGFGGSVKAN